jgi:two-component system NtrC family sensor kinase
MHQQATHQYRGLYQTLLNSLSQRVFLLDNDLTILFANQVAARASNFSKEDYLYRPFLEVVPLGKDSPFLSCISNVIETREPAHVIDTMMSVDGRSRWFDLHVTPVPGGVLCLSTDITELKRVELALLESERRLRGIFENAAIGIGILGLEGVFLDSNQALRDLFGYDEATLHSITINDLIHEDDTARHHDMLKQVTQGKSQHYQLELRFLKKDGNPVWCNLTVSMDFDTDNEPLFVIAMLEDVSEKHRVVNALKQREEQSNRQYKGIPVPTYTWQEQDGDFVLIDYNLAAESFTQGEIVNLIGKKASQEFENDPMTLEDFRQCYENQVTVTRSRTYKLLSTGQENYLIVSFVFVPSDLVMVHTIDITERERVQAALSQSEERFRSMVEHTSEAIFCYEYDPPIPLDLPREEQIQRLYDAVLVECNDVAALSYGEKNAEAVRGRPLKQLFGTNISQLDSFFTEFLDGGCQIVDLEAREIRPDGEVRYFLNNGQGVIEDGKLLRVWGTFRDITEQQRLEAAETAQRNFAEALYEMASDLLDSTLDSEDVLDRVLLHLERAVTYDGAVICMADEGIALPVRHRGFTDAGNARALRHFNLSVSQTHDLKTMSETRAPYRIGDTRHDADWRPLPGLGWVRSFLGAPILAENAVVGFVILFSKTPHTFTDSDSKKLKAFADQAAIAMENARLYQAIHQRVAEFELLWQTGLNITAWLEDLQAVLELVLDAALHLDSAADVAGIYLFDESELRLGAMRWASNKSARPNLELKPHHLHTATMLSGQESFHEGVLAKELFAGEALVGKAGMINLPLMGREETVGVISIYYLDNRPPSKEHLRAARLLSFQAAAGIENAQIYRKLDQYAGEVSKLSHATFSLFTSFATTQNPEDVYENIVDCVINAFGQVDCGIIAYDRTGGHLKRQARKGKYNVSIDKEIDVQGAGLVPTAIRSGETIYAPDVSKDTRYIPNEPRTRSELVVPLKQGKTVIGVLDLQSTKLDAFDRSDLRLMHAFASRAATTIENVQLVQNLRESEERFRQLAENVSDVFFLCTLDYSELLYVSPAYQVVWDAKPAALYDDFMQAFLASAHPEDRQTISELMQSEARALSEGTGSSRQFEFRIKLHSGETRWIRMQLFPVENGVGSVYRLAILAQDSTEQKRAANLSAAGEIATGVAHQINNPLTAIIAQSHLIQKHLDPDSPLHKNIRVVMDAAYRAGAVAQRMLEFAQIAHYDFDDVDVNNSARYAIELVRAQLEPDSAQLRVDLADDLPLIYGSQHHLEDLWLNLILNARDAIQDTQSAQITVSSALDEAGSFVEVTVQDNGRGIPHDNLEQIFDPFFTTKSHGNGLGLAVCRDIIIKHGGDIQVESQEGQGTTLRVQLPIIKAKASEA